MLNIFKKALANIFRFLLKIPFFRKRFFGFHKRIFAPFNLFKGVTQIIKFKNKIILELHIDDWIQENIYFLDKYEEAELKFIKDSLNKGDLFIDIGANIGLHTLFASNIVGEYGRIISFEPFGVNYKRLIKNVFLNKRKNIELENLAISHKNLHINIYYNDKEANLGMPSSYLVKSSNFEKVKAVSLDSYLKNKHIDKVDFIKIDIEGGEYYALLGMKKILLKYKPKLLVEILEDSSLSQLKNEKKIIDFLKSIGYMRYFIDDNGKLSLIKKNKSRMNYAFVKNK